MMLSDLTLPYMQVEPTGFTNKVDILSQTTGPIAGNAGTYALGGPAATVTISLGPRNRLETTGYTTTFPRLSLKWSGDKFDMECNCFRGWDNQRSF